MSAKKTVSESKTSMTQIVLPSHTNALGTIFGGTVMSWIDIAGAIAAGRHARRTVVTVSFDALHFLAPIKLGQVVEVQAMVNRAFKTSMEVGVRVDSEDLKTGNRTHHVSAYATFVALDDNGKPCAVSEAIAESEDEKKRHKEALLRKESRIELAKKRGE